MNEKKKIKNNFFDIIFLLFSFFLSFFRGIYKFLFGKKIQKNNYFFLVLDFIFRLWPRYFWKKPSLYKIFSMPSNLINYIFKK